MRKVIRFCKNCCKKKNVTKYVYKEENIFVLTFLHVLEIPGNSTMRL